MKKSNLKTKHIHCKVEAELKTILISRARKENRSQGSIVREALKKHLTNP